MASKKKLSISLSIAAVALIAAIVAIVAVFAAANQTVTSSIKVTYTANANVVGTVSATYSVGSIVDHSMTTNGELAGADNALITFDTDTTEGTQALQLQKSDLTNDGAVQFTKDARELVIKFNFVNAGPAQYTATVSKTETTTYTNMKIQYSATGAEDSWADDPAIVTVAGVDTIGETNSAFYFIKVYVDNPSFDASFNGTFSWALAA